MLFFYIDLQKTGFMKLKLFVIVQLLILTNIFAQYGDNGFSISANFSYTTTSRLFLFPNSIDKVLRNQSLPLDDILSYSAEIRYRIYEDLVLGLSVEYITKSEFGKNLTAGASRIDVDDGYKVFPIELTAYYILPFSTENFKFYMGGGGGIYIGEHVRKFGDVAVTNDTREFAYGIHASVGMEYMVVDFFSVRGEMKFRDPEFEMKSKYNKETTEYQGRIITLPSKPFDSKVNIDGIVFTVGAVFHF